MPLPSESTSAFQLGIPAETVDQGPRVLRGHHLLSHGDCHPSADRLGQRLVAPRCAGCVGGPHVMALFGMCLKNWVSEGICPKFYGSASFSPKWSELGGISHSQTQPNTCTA